MDFKDNWQNLEFERNCTLNKLPLEIDMVVSKIDASIGIENEIGRIFRKYNIMEYKSERDELDIKTLMKVEAYACLYLSGQWERALLDFIMDLSMRANRGLVEMLKESGNMNAVLRELFEPELEEVEREANQRLLTETRRVERETREAQIKLAVKSMRRFHVGDDDIQTTLTEDYGLSEEEALSYL